MPLYEYLCQKCGHRFERIQKFSDKIVTKCAECGGRVERVISAPAVQFKGSGWYVTDYANKSGAPSNADGGKDKDSKAETAKTESAGKESSSKESAGKESAAKETAKASSSKKADKNK
jgi:putative FmdB family regulatory protein